MVPAQLWMRMWLLSRECGTALYSTHHSVCRLSPLSAKGSLTCGSDCGQAKSAMLDVKDDLSIYIYHASLDESSRSTFIRSD